MAEPQQRIQWESLASDFPGSQPIQCTGEFPPCQLTSGRVIRHGDKEVPYTQQCTLPGAQRERGHSLSILSRTFVETRRVSGSIDYACWPFFSYPIEVSYVIVSQFFFKFS